MSVVQADPAQIVRGRRVEIATKARGDRRGGSPAPLGVGADAIEESVGKHIKTVAASTRARRR